MPWLDLTRTLELVADLRAELDHLAEGSDQCQREALHDAMVFLDLFEQDVQDAAPPHGEHSGDTAAGRQLEERPERTDAQPAPRPWFKS